MSPPKSSKPRTIPVVGSHAVAALLDGQPELLLELWLSTKAGSRHHQLAEQARSLGVAVQSSHPETLAKIDPSHRGIIGWARPPACVGPERLLAGQGLVLALDGVTDAHNFGACLRSAEAAGGCALLLPRRNSAGVSAGAAKSSSGALFRVPLVAVDSLPKTLQQLRDNGWQILGLSEHARVSVYTLAPHPRRVVVAGNEQVGLSPRVADCCNQLICLPAKGKNASLNVSVAAGAALLWLGAQQAQ